MAQYYIGSGVSAESSRSGEDARKLWTVNPGLDASSLEPASENPLPPPCIPFSKVELSGWLRDSSTFKAVSYALLPGDVSSVSWFWAVGVAAKSCLASTDSEISAGSCDVCRASGGFDNAEPGSCSGSRGIASRSAALVRTVDGAELSLVCGRGSEEADESSRGLLVCLDVTDPGSTNCPAPSSANDPPCACAFPSEDETVQHTRSVEYDDDEAGFAVSPGAVSEFLSRNERRVPYWQSKPPSRHRWHLGFPSSPVANWPAVSASNRRTYQSTPVLIPTYIYACAHGISSSRCVSS
ncbi:unnamed protein product [Clonostachys solani]|uniref:Uncharacterized protein n=1 Tax=Clonostachys solani TaxID=160281 RepID=A0A9N9Z7C3_9HYPO|nr:unnamed protein product [Clonostachys solani]